MRGHGPRELAATHLLVRLVNPRKEHACYRSACGVKGFRSGIRQNSRPRNFSPPHVVAGSSRVRLSGYGLYFYPEVVQLPSH